MNSIKINEDLDLEFAADGTVAIDTGAQSTINLLEFDITMNSGWMLDDRLGMKWVDNKGEGLLQKKGTLPMLVTALRSRILSYDGVKSVDSIKVGRNLKREATFFAEVKLHSGETFTLQV